MNDKAFWTQVGAAEEKHGPRLPFLVFFKAEHVPKYNSKEEAMQGYLESLKAINEYDPMQFHGIKTNAELWEMVEQHFEPVKDGPFEGWNRGWSLYNKLDFSIDKGIASVNTAHEDKERLEATEGFIDWLE